MIKRKSEDLKRLCGRLARALEEAADDYEEMLEIAYKFANLHVTKADIKYGAGYWRKLVNEYKTGEYE